MSLNISLWATVPAYSEHDEARAGMPNLDALVQLGPSLDFHLWRSDGDRMQLDLRLPARVALTVASPPRDVGWIAAPHLNLDIRHIGAAPGWDLGILAGPLFAAQRYNQYFYSVPPAYATAQRPAYDAPGGYAGAEIITALFQALPQFLGGRIPALRVLARARIQEQPADSNAVRRIRGRGNCLGDLALAP